MMSCVHTYYIHRKQLKFYAQTIYHYMATDVEQPLQLYTSYRAHTNDIKLAYTFHLIFHEYPVKAT